MTSWAGLVVAFRPAGVSCNFVPAGWASPAAWSSIGQANACMARSDAGSWLHSQRSASRVEVALRQHPGDGLHGRLRGPAGLVADPHLARVDEAEYRPEVVQGSPCRVPHPQLHLLLVRLAVIRTQVDVRPQDPGGQVVAGLDRQRGRLGDEGQQHFPQVAGQHLATREEEAEGGGPALAPVAAGPAEVGGPAVLGPEPLAVPDAIGVVDGLLHGLAGQVVQAVVAGHGPAPASP